MQSYAIYVYGLVLKYSGEEPGLGTLPQHTCSLMKQTENVTEGDARVTQW